MANATSPVVDLLPEGEVGEKRKRSLSDATDEECLSQEPKRIKTDATESEVKEEKSEAVGADCVRYAIESHFSLEILYKHSELRLIKQELAKCQVALEQLRRCSLIPYPISQGTPESMFNVSNGSGQAVNRRESVPQWAAPYGVTDGPYSRHYAKWLIPDARFDGGNDDPFEPLRSGKTVPEGRSTRNSVSISEFSTPANRSRSQRGSTAQKHQALSSGYSQAKEKPGPCILRRKDGEWVKLVCLDCSKPDFSSTQGFINHCRISHHRDFKSHEQAAIACGQPIEVEDGVPVAEERAPTSTGHVHPMIPGTPADKEACAALISRIAASVSMFEQGKLPGVTSIPTAPGVSPHQKFVESPETPHLSKLLARRGFGVNLTDVVNEAKVKVDFDELAHEGDSEGDDDSLPTPLGLDGANSPVAKRMPARAAMSPAAFGRPTSSKGKLGIPSSMPYSTPVSATAPQLPRPHHVDTASPPDLDGDIDMMVSYENLSPNTVTSNNAPSLVSDDGEYDEGEEEAESATSDDEEGSVAEIDIEDGEGDKVVARTVLQKGSMKKDDKHVTFVSPVKEANGRTHT